MALLRPQPHLHTREIAALLGRERNVSCCHSRALACGYQIDALPHLRGHR